MHGRFPREALCQYPGPDNRTAVVPGYVRRRKRGQRYARRIITVCRAFNRRFGHRRHFGRRIVPGKRTGSRPYKGTAPESAGPAAPANDTTPPRTRSLPAKLWFGASSTVVGVMVVGAIAFTFVPWRFAYPEAFFRGLVTSMGVLLYFIPGWLVSTNAFGFCDKIPYLRNHRIGAGIAITVAAMVLGYALILAATSNLSPEYLQVLQANGADTV